MVRPWWIVNTLPGTIPGLKHASVIAHYHYRRLTLADVGGKICKSFKRINLCARSDAFTTDVIFENIKLFFAHTLGPKLRTLSIELPFNAGIYY